MPASNDSRISKNEALKYAEPFAFKEIARQFFGELLEGTNNEDVCFFVVGHILTTLQPFLSSLQEIGTVEGVLRKGSKVDDAAYADIEGQYQILPWTRAHTAQVDDTLDEIDSRANGRRVILIDIGGYFANVAESPRCNDSLVGIVEDTENGHQKYEARPDGKKRELKIPVISVARSLSKRTEDRWVGHSIVYSTEKLLRTGGSTILSKKILVIGFGKIGHSIADCLKRRGNIVSVWDTDPIARVYARNNDFQVHMDKCKALKDADVVFCATGNGSISGAEFLNLKPGSVVASATSADDEFSGDKMPHVTSEDLGRMTKYEHNGHYFYLAHKGNAVNFLDGAEIRPYIYLVQGAMLAAARTLLDGRHENAISELPIEVERELSLRFESSFFLD